MRSKKMSVRELSSIAIFAAIITVCAQISIPMPHGVPMTLHTFAVPLAGMILGKRNGTLASLVYVTLGLAGVPVFAEFTGGAGIVFGVSGGFILSFPLVSFAAGIAAERKTKLMCITWLLIGLVVNFLCGMFMFCVVHSGHVMTFLIYIALPYIPLDVLKIGLVVALSKSIKTALVKSKLLT